MATKIKLTDNSLQTRRYPRTMVEAFGPYTTNHIDEPGEDSNLLALLACVCVGLVCLVAAAAGVL